MGLAIDPHYAQNHWIYLYYSPVGDQSINQLSRFVFQNNNLDIQSEKIILKVGVQRLECCHTGGCIRITDDGTLYLSTGDNSNPFASEGYDPMDERPGRSPWDAQKSSANTNDLRGKILRIKPLDPMVPICARRVIYSPIKKCTSLRPNRRAPASTVRKYTSWAVATPTASRWIPAANLLFWGEVGPDAGEPDTARGPAGHDEVNRARAAGFFGWPYFVADNKPYHHYDFSTEQDPVRYFDPVAPPERQPQQHRKPQPAPGPAGFYLVSLRQFRPNFRWSAKVAGMRWPAPYILLRSISQDATRFPDYYNGKLITYDWMRGWMMAITVDSVGNFSRMEPFGDSIVLSRPMDMLVDKNGSFWVLEYGTQWFSSNPDARLSRIDYVRGNRPPMPVLQADKLADAAPCTINFSAAKTRDYDHERLQYEIDFGDGSPVLEFEGRFPQAQSTATLTAHKALKKNPLDSIVHIFSAIGTYEVTLKVSDEKDFRLVKQKISVGNAPPQVHWDFGGQNRSYYTPGDILHYRLLVSDPEDGSLETGRIAANTIATTIDYLATGFDITSIVQGHQAAMQQAEYAKGKGLIDRSDCKTCHAVDRLVNGPSFQAVAARYKGNEFAVRDLSQKVIKGGAGNWGQVVMSAHPQVSEEDAGEMVRWILSLGAPAKPKQAFPVSGEYPLVVQANPEKGKKAYPGTYILKASYRDRGSNSQASLEDGETIALRPAFQQAEQADSMSKSIDTYRPYHGDTVVLTELKHHTFFVFKRSDLTGVRTIDLGIGSGDQHQQFSGGRLELHLDYPDGPLAGSVQVPEKNAPGKMEFYELILPITLPPDHKFHDLYFVVKNEKNPSKSIMAVDWLRFNL